MAQGMVLESSDGDGLMNFCFVAIGFIIGFCVCGAIHDCKHIDIGPHVTKSTLLSSVVLRSYITMRYIYQDVIV